MLIISKWKDFYDSVKTYGVDKTVVYNRRQQRMAERPHWSDNETIEGRLEKLISRTHHGRGGVVGFCGKIYPFIELTFRGKAPHFRDRYEYYYDADSLFKRLKELKINLNNPEAGYSSFGRRLRRRKNKRQEIIDFFQKDFSFVEAWFGKYKAVSFVVGSSYNSVEGEIVNKYPPINNCWGLINPKLADHQFWKVKPTAQAFQDIYMYISGVLGVPLRLMVEISDADMQAKKGFTHRYSFRKEPKNL